MNKLKPTEISMVNVVLHDVDFQHVAALTGIPTYK